LEMTKLFPDEPDLGFIYAQGPWWAVTHFSKFWSHDYETPAYSIHSHSGYSCTASGNDLPE
jgi:hypothetical protein